MTRRSALLLTTLLAGAIHACGLAPLLHGQALTPEEALARFKVADGFEVQLFASEPQVRQPVTMTFDDRGRMWVIQYLQYPAPAGLKPVEVDRYLRTKYDRVPEPPPRGPRGVDKITILEDTDGDGRVDRTKDFVDGLNLATALALGDDGVYVGQAPYLLFYPDRNHDDVPDGDPEVLLTGFGMEDAHAVVNSLQWGPDGWLYGTQGSTVTADVRGIGFQQGIWRYHPGTKRFELFSEGGGNTWGLDFDRHGQAIAGTNFGERLCLHQVQGGYYVKGFSKHGPLHNPYSYGYFEHCAHTGHAGGHVTCGGIVYQGGAFPAAFNGTYISADLLSNAIYYSALEPAGSTFATRYLGTLLSTDDMWFRPIDCLIGPDGAVFVADWYDKRANHVIPEDTWDKTNGRIWKITHRAARPAGAVEKFDLGALSSEKLVDLLDHDNVWYRRQARRILGERRDPAVHARLLGMIEQKPDEQLALEALWALCVSGGGNDELAGKLLEHPSADVRAWTVRLIGDEKRALSQVLRNALLSLANREPSVTVRSQLACTCKRLPGNDGLAIVARLLERDEDARDPHVPLLLWWAIEDKAISNQAAVLDLVAAKAWDRPLVQGTIVERLARRYLAEKSDMGYAACARLLALAPSPAEVRKLLVAMDQDLSGRPLSTVPGPLVPVLERLLSADAESREKDRADPTVVRFALRLGSAAAYERALARLSDPKEPQAVRLAFIAAVGQATRPADLTRLLALLDENEPEPIRTAALGAIGHFDNGSIASEILARYGKFNAALRARSISLLCARAAWACELVQAVDNKNVDAKDVSIDQARQMLAHADERLTAAVEARWGKIRPATLGEKMSYVPVLSRVLNEAPGDLDSGHQVFVKHCAVCHTLFGEGNKVGPDLTTADRKNRDALLLNILDPSGYVRPEYVSQTLVLADGRVLTGLVTENTAQQITLVDAKNQKTTVPRGEIEQLAPATQSLMPERLLEVLPPQELRDLFRYLQSEAPPATGNAGK